MLILDTPPEERFDRVVRFADEEFDIPTVLVSLVDEKRQWFKARVGMAACETDRESSFCGHAIVQPQIMVVPDALQDERFLDNPLVTGAPHRACWMRSWRCGRWPRKRRRRSARSRSHAASRSA